MSNGLTYSEVKASPGATHFLHSIHALSADSLYYSTRNTPHTPHLHRAHLSHTTMSHTCTCLLSFAALCLELRGTVPDSD